MQESKSSISPLSFDEIIRRVLKVKPSKEKKKSRPKKTAHKATK